MPTINNYKDINGFLTATALDIKIRFRDFVIFQWEDMTGYNCLENIPYRKHFFEISFQQEGHPVKLDHYNFSGEGSKLFLVNPYRIQSCETDTRHPVNGFTVLFTPEFLHIASTDNYKQPEVLLGNYFNNPEITLTEKAAVEFIDLFSKMKDEYQQEDNLFSRAIIQHYLQILLLLARKYAESARTTDPVNNRPQDIYNRFMNLVQQHSLQQSGVKFYADQMHLTPKHLSSTIKIISGMTALQIIHNARIHHAKSLLRQTTATISEIADTLHFENPDYFSAFFKKHTGINPLKYRQS